MTKPIVFNIWCAGRNYQDHAAEMGSPNPISPIIFLKPGATLVTTSEIQLPSASNEIHYELELAFQFDECLELTSWTLALDLTNRNAQTFAKSQGLPWTLAKAFKGSCPILWPPRKITNWEDLETIEMELWIQNKLRQKGALREMIFSPRKLAEYVKHHFPVQQYDLLLTGTPAGVGPLSPGDRLEARLKSINSGVFETLMVWDVHPPSPP